MTNKMDVILSNGQYRKLEDLRWLSEGDAVFSKRGELLVVANDCDYDHLLSFIRQEGDDIIQWVATLRNTEINQDGLPQPINKNSEFFEARYKFGEQGSAETYKVLSRHYHGAKSRKEDYDRQSPAR